MTYKYKRLNSNGLISSSHYPIAHHSGQESAATGRGETGQARRGRRDGARWYKCWDGARCMGQVLERGRRDETRRGEVVLVLGRGEVGQVLGRGEVGQVLERGEVVQMLGWGEVVQALERGRRDGAKRGGVGQVLGRGKVGQMIQGQPT
ncbi:hypothetical protein Pcinc_005064 [Petrolisthes cinctipes]|uniref:Uncharacterized protein n=1 Tax=Petrolisthes cinctipes TaxID=88211 RepID=A0AAE1GEB7_PETCI|nr:hypothetical protein Pcinc_005064 [Petrolisthes cinctipes]